MRGARAVTTLFLDIGGVLLTDGWDGRRHAAKAFKLDSAEMEERQHMTFETYQEGKLTLEDYLDLIVFGQKRSFKFVNIAQGLGIRSIHQTDYRSTCVELDAYGLQSCDMVTA